MRGILFPSKREDQSQRTFPKFKEKEMVWLGFDAGLPDSQRQKVKKKKNVLHVSPMGALQSVLCRHCFLSLQQP